jgi:putative tryptophan/tyrosine transport system substrate-binding protein
MRRREFIAGLASAAAWPLTARGQQGERPRRIGIFMNTAKDDPDSVAEVATLRTGLAERGWIEGRTILIEVRWPGGNIELIETMAKELVGLKPNLLISRTSPATRAFKRERERERERETGVVPIVFVNVAQPVEQGFVQSLARPGGNVTGFTYLDATIGGKWLRLLKEIDPRIVRVGAIYNPLTAPYGKSYVRSIESAGAGLGVEIIAMPVESDGDIEAAMTALARLPYGGVVVIPDAFTIDHRGLIIAQAARLRLPAAYGFPNFARSGGLMAYAVDPRDTMRRASEYVDRILKGEQPGDLPAQQPTRFSFVINRKVADALGPTIPSQLLALADKVIE